MNPLLPEPVNNLGRNVSHGVKPGAKLDVMDSDDSTRFQDTLQANTPERRKPTASKTSGGTPENAATQTAVHTPIKQPPQSGSHSQNATPSLESETEENSNPSLILETAAINVDDPVAGEGAPVFAAVSENDGKTVTTPLLLQAGQSAKMTSEVAQFKSSSPGATIQATIQETTVTQTALNNTPGSAAPVAIPDTDLGSEISPEAMTGTNAAPGIVRITNADNANVTGKPASGTAQAELEKPFTSLETDLNLTDAGVDKKPQIGKPAGAAVNPGIPFSPQPAYVKSNFDWQFANRMPALEADAALDIPSVPKGSSSATGTAYSAVSAVAAMQINEAVADHRVQMPVNIKFGQPEWAGMVAERTAMIAAQKISFAELQLDPPELGPLHVKVTVHNDQASVNFVSANPAVRDSLEQTSVRLREMFDQQGVDLVDVNVADQSDRQQQNPGDSHPNSRRASTAEDDIPTSGTVNLMTVVASGIDHYV